MCVNGISYLEYEGKGNIITLKSLIMNKKNKQERKEILSKILDLKKLSPTVKNKKIIQKLQQQLENHE